MLFHYTREYGPEGCILTNEGTAAGSDLTALLARGRPPLRAALELGAALADILSVSLEDKIVHGDIKPGFVKIDAVGAVSIEGWGPVRGTCRAPEAQPVGPSTDVYALGIVLHALMASEPLGALPREPDAHDDAVVHKVLAMDFGEAGGKRWVQELRQFIALCMAFDQAERPEALDVANVLAHVAEQCPEPGLQRWAARLVPQISGDAAPRAVPEPLPEEDLAGPTFSHGPLQTGMFKPQARTAPAAKGESTAFWTKDKIDAMLAAEDAEAEAEAEHHAAAGGFGARSQPVPFDEPLSEARPAPMSRPAPAPYTPPAPLPTPPQPRPAPQPAPPQPRPVPQPAPPQPRPAPQAPIAQGPVIQGPVAQGPIAQGPTAAPPAPQPAKKSSLGKIIVIAVLLLILGGGVLLAAAGGAWFFYFRAAPADPITSQPAVEQPEPPAKPVRPPEDTGSTTAKPTGQPAAKPASASTTGSTRTASSSRPSGTRSTSTGSSTSTRSGTPAGTGTPPTPTPSTPNPDELAGGGKYTVRFVAQGHEASLTCGDGQQANFVSSTQLDFEGVVTCMVQIEGARGAVQVRKAQTVTCTIAGTQVSCGGG